MRTATRARHVLFVLLGTTWRWPRLATVRSAWPAPLTTTTHRRQIARRVLRASMLLRARLRRLALFASRGRRIWTAMRRRTATIAWLVGTLAWIGRLCASLVSRGSTLQQSRMLARTVRPAISTTIATPHRPVHSAQSVAMPPLLPLVPVAVPTALPDGWTTTTTLAPNVKTALLEHSTRWLRETEAVTAARLGFLPTAHLQNARPALAVSLIMILILPRIARPALLVTLLRKVDSF